MRTWRQFEAPCLLRGTHAADRVFIYDLAAHRGQIVFTKDLTLYPARLERLRPDSVRQPVASNRGRQKAEPQMILNKIRQHLWALVFVLSALLVVAFVLLGLLWRQLDQTRGDLERVESSTVLFALQIGALQAQVTELEPTLSANLDQAVIALKSLTGAPFELRAELEESIGIETQIPLKQNLVVPIELTVPIEESIRTTIEVEGPLGIAVPVNVTIPIDLDIPIATDVIVPLDVTIPFEAQVPVQIDAPIKLDFRETELASLMESLLGLLIELQALLADLK